MKKRYNLSTLVIGLLMIVILLGVFVLIKPKITGNAVLSDGEVIGVLSNSYSCGNSITEMGEACDGADVNGFTCATVAAGFNAGNLKCNADCKSYDVSQCVTGDTIYAESCNKTDVQNAINNASDGDIVVVPAGICTWNTGATITNGIFVRGAGTEKTSIISKNNSAGVLFGVNVNSNRSFRISGFKFSGEVSWAFISLEGFYSNLRIDHIDFEGADEARGMALNYLGRRTNKGIVGLFDHLNINISRGTFVGLYGANNAWNRPDNYGTNDFIFLEDITIQGNSRTSLDLIDGECGARFVVRNNSLINTRIGYHDTGSTSGCRSTRLVEIYNNDFSCTIAGYPSCGWTAISFRGGTGVYYNNIISSYYEDGIGYDTGAATQLWRSYTPGGLPWNTTCDGTFDRICSDFYSHCNGGDKRACGGNWDCVGAGTCSIHQCTTDDDCGANAFCLQKTDGHLDLTGWPCRDQTGRGMDNNVTHEQEISPAFWWDNKKMNGGLTNVFVNPHSVLNFSFIISGRDFYNDSVNYNSLTEMYESAYVDDYGLLKEWNYKPYPYPHPLSLIEPLSEYVSPSVCPNSICESGENCSTCVSDCGICVVLSINETCGNGYCNATAGENCSGCASDCGACAVDNGGGNTGGGGGGSGNNQINNSNNANLNRGNAGYVGALKDNIGTLAGAVKEAFSLNDEDVLGNPQEVFEEVKMRNIVRFIMFVGICILILFLWMIKIVLKHHANPVEEIIERGKVEYDNSY